MRPTGRSTTAGKGDATGAVYIPKSSLLQEITRKDVQASWQKRVSLR
jgi:hypothetical protein